MTPRTLPREPWRGSMICGYQVSSGGWSHPMAWCAERKEDYRPVCRAHWDDLVAEGAQVAFAAHNTLGAPHWEVRLLWEGDDPDVPIEASAEELARYAALVA